MVRELARGLEGLHDMSAALQLPSFAPDSEIQDLDAFSNQLTRALDASRFLSMVKPCFAVS